ncbi:MAG: efflux transporter periplasmic adaptor subunit, partial [Muribaculaceae bacterium]|nr:efflux transporter periplasmic adaptor subunit [Muribaculaceae bacterium]
DAGQTIATIGNGSSLMLRADVPVSQTSFIHNISSANIILPGHDSDISIDEAGGKLINPSTAAASGGYIPVYFTLTNSGQLLPGTNVEVYLKGHMREDALVIPRDAVTEQQGTYFAYVQLDEDCYRKCPVKLGNSDGNNVEILSGLNPGDEVVTIGAIIVKLAESSGAVPEGHSHNH